MTHKKSPRVVRFLSFVCAALARRCPHPPHEKLLLHPLDEETNFLVVRHVDVGMDKKTGRFIGIHSDAVIQELYTGLQQVSSNLAARDRGLPVIEAGGEISRRSPSC